MEDGGPKPRRLVIWSKGLNETPREVGICLYTVEKTKRDPEVQQPDGAAGKAYRRMARDGGRADAGSDMIIRLKGL